MATEGRQVVLKAREAAEYLRISLFTLNKMERQGLLMPFRTPGGHRRYTLEMLNQYVEENRFAMNSLAKTEERR
jgi:excisionase family DNA binding protein